MCLESQRRDLFAEVGIGTMFYVWHKYYFQLIAMFKKCIFSVTSFQYTQFNNLMYDCVFNEYCAIHCEYIQKNV